MVFYAVSVNPTTARYSGTYTLPIFICFTDQRNTTVTVGSAIRNPRQYLSSGTGFVGRATSSIIPETYGNVFTLLLH